MKPPKIFNPLDIFIEKFNTATEGLNVLVRLIIAIILFAILFAITFAIFGVIRSIGVYPVHIG